MSAKYRTIVADPPWRTTAGPVWTGRKGIDAHGVGPSRPLPYPTMSTESIARLPVAELATPAAHLYLWTINAYLESAYSVARAWGFRPAQVLTWAKTPRGLGLGGAYSSTTEFILFCRRGVLPTIRKIDSTWFNWKRPEDGTGPCHSRKPEAFQDLVESVSPGPYLELFARRPRVGWSVWGNEVESDIRLAAAA